MTAPVRPIGVSLIIVAGVLLARLVIAQEAPPPAIDTKIEKDRQQEPFERDVSLRTTAGMVTSIRVGQGGRFAAVCSGNMNTKGACQIWDLSLAKPTDLSNPILSEPGVNDSVFLDEGRTLVVGIGRLSANGNGVNSELVVWDIDRQKERRRIPCRDACVMRLVASPAGNVFAVAEWDIYKPALAAEQPPVGGAAYGRKASTKGESYFGGRIRVWNSDGEELATLYRFPGTAMGVSFSADGHLMAGGGPEWIGVWETTDWQLKWEMESPAYGVEFVGAFDDLVIATRFGPSLVANVNSGGRFAKLDISGTDFAEKSPPKLARTDPKVTSVAATPNGRVLVVGAKTGDVVLWDVSDGRRIAQIPAHKGKVTAVAFDISHAALLTGGEDEMVHRWRLGSEVDQLVRQETFTRPQIDPNALRLLSPAKVKPVANITELVSTAESLAGNGNFVEARRLQQQAVTQTRQRLRGQNQDAQSTTASPELGGRLTSLGVFQCETGDVVAAESTLREAIELLQSQDGVLPRLELARAMTSLGRMHVALGNFDEANRMFGRSQEIFTIYAPASTQGLVWSAECKLERANLAELQGDYERVKTFVDSGLLALGDVSGVSHPVFRKNRLMSLVGPARLTLVRLLVLRARSLRRKGDLAASQQELEVAAAASSRTTDFHGLEVAQVLQEFASNRSRQGDWVAAEESRRMVLDTCQRKLGTSHPETATVLGALGWTHARLGKTADASDELQRSCLALRTHALSVLPVLPRGQQIGFLSSHFREGYYRSLDAAIQNSQEVPLQEVAAATVLNLKCLAQEVLSQREWQAHDEKDPSTVDLATRLQNVRVRLASAYYVRQSSVDNDQIAKLLREESALAKELGRLLKTSFSHEPWIELSAVQGSLPEDSVLVELAHVEGGRLGPDQEGCYVAWIIPPTGEITMVNLGDATKLGGAIAAVMESMNSGSRASSAARREALAELSDRLLAPLIDGIAKYHNWIFSPDASLWLVPWAGMLLPDKSYAVESHNMSVVVTGRQFASGWLPASSGRGLVLVDPDFGKAATTDRWPRLPGTGHEGRRIASSVQSPVDVRTGLEATEHNFLSAQHPSLLLIGTHGFFLPKTPAVAHDESHGSDNLPKLPQATDTSLLDPLLQSGIVLAGANQLHELPAESSEDGMVTALEITGIDLRGTDLVILSTCDSGRGAIQSGEGVACLRQAFTLAGSRSVVSSLWHVTDQVNEELMSSFFDYLAEGYGKSEALCRAQRKMLREGRGDSCDPRYWAAWSVTGDAGATQVAFKHSVSVEPDTVKSPPIPLQKQNRSLYVAGAVLGILVGIVWAVRRYRAFSV